MKQTNKTASDCYTSTSHNFKFPVNYDSDRFIKATEEKFLRRFERPCFLCKKHKSGGAGGKTTRNTKEKLRRYFFAQNGKQPRETCMLYIWAVAVQAVAIPLWKQQQ